MWVYLWIYSPVWTFENTGSKCRLIFKLFSESFIIHTAIPILNVPIGLVPKVVWMIKEGPGWFRMVWILEFVSILCSRLWRLEWMLHVVERPDNSGKCEYFRRILTQYLLSSFTPQSAHLNDGHLILILILTNATEGCHISSVRYDVHAAWLLSLCILSFTGILFKCQSWASHLLMEVINNAGSQNRRITV